MDVKDVKVHTCGSGSVGLEGSFSCRQRRKVDEALCEETRGEKRRKVEEEQSRAASALLMPCS